MKSADLILTGGRVTTMSEESEVEAVAIAGERILAMGTTAEMLELCDPSTQVIDVGGRRVIPGLIDAHVHFARAGFTWNEEVRWGPVASLEEGLELIRSRADEVPKGSWITVIGGWHPAQFEEDRHPTLEDLDRVAPNHPVLVQFLYDWGMVNSAGWDLIPWDRAVSAGVVEETLDRDDTGRATGVIRTLPSLRWLYAQLPKPNLEQQVASTTAAGIEFARYGITGVIDGGGANTGPDVYRPIYETWRRGQLVPRVRLTMHSSSPGEEEADMGGYLRFAHPGQGDDKLRVLGLGEIVMWAFHDGFSRLPDLSEENRRRLEEILRIAAERGWTVQQHIIRPETTDVVIDLWYRIHQETPIDRLRWSIVHGESITEKHIDRLAEMGAGIVAEALLRFEGEHAIELWGADTMAFSPPIQKLRDGGVMVSVGSDGLRGATYNPFATLQWLVTGRSLSGAQVWDADNVLDRHTALALVTREAAWFSFEEESRGRIEPGFLADIAVLSDDYFRVSSEEMTQLRSDLTLVGGEIVWNDLEPS